MIETTILSNLIFNDEYTRKVVPFIKGDYFRDSSQRVLFEIISNYIQKYNASPSKEALSVELNSTTTLTENQYKECTDIVETLSYDVNTNIDWLVEQTEKFCQDQAIFNAISKSIKILNDEKGSITKGAIPQLLSDALAVSFDTAVGHDLIEDWEKRYDFYHMKENKIPFDLDYMNKVTKGGLSNKTLNIFMAGTGAGKSMMMCHCATANILAGYNVLYITLEMSEEKIAERIDANMMNISIDELAIIPKDVYTKKIEKIKSKTIGKLVIKEYPTSSAGSNNFRYLLNELKIKKNFIPHIIYVDYLNICTSSRLKSGVNVNSYTYVKSIAEEIRGLAVEFNVPIVSATQTNRSGYSDSDVGMENVSESFGLPATADLMFALITNEQLISIGQMMIKQLKNRYSDPNMFNKFVVGVDRSKMRVYNVEQSAQQDIITDNTYTTNKFTPVKGQKKINKSAFEDFQ